MEGKGGVADAEVKASFFNLHQYQHQHQHQHLQSQHHCQHHPQYHSKHNPADKVTAFLKDWVNGALGGFLQVRMFFLQILVSDGWLM